MTLAELTSFLDETLKLGDFPNDYSNNGIQVEGESEVTRAVFAVDACLESIEYAEDTKADLLFVHHGISWGTGFRRLTGMTAKRLRVLFNSGITLYAAHLPLDAHPTLGNNACISRVLGLKNLTPFFELNGASVGFSGTLSRACTAETLAGKLKAASGSAECDFYGDPEGRFKRIAVVSGSVGESVLQQAAECGVELLVTGEIGHQHYHPARELGLNVLAAGHYATETFGPRAVMAEVAKRFDVEVEFADFPTGM